MADSSQVFTFRIHADGAGVEVQLRHVGAGRVVPSGPLSPVAELFASLTAEDVDRVTDELDSGVADIAAPPFALHVAGPTCTVRSDAATATSVGTAELRNRLDDFRVFLSRCIGDVVELTLTEHGTAYRYRIGRRTGGYGELVDSADAGVARHFVEDLQSADDAEFFLDRIDAVRSGAETVVHTGGNITDLKITSEVCWLKSSWDRGRGVPLSTAELRDQLIRLRDFLARTRG